MNSIIYLLLSSITIALSTKTCAMEKMEMFDLITQQFAADLQKTATDNTYNEDVKKLFAMPLKTAIELQQKKKCLQENATCPALKSTLDKAQIDALKRRLFFETRTSIMALSEQNKTIKQTIDQNTHETWCPTLGHLHKLFGNAIKTHAKTVVQTQSQVNPMPSTFSAAQLNKSQSFADIKNFYAALATGKKPSAYAGVIPNVTLTDHSNTPNPWNCYCKISSPDKKRWVKIYVDPKTKCFLRFFVHDELQPKNSRLLPLLLRSLSLEQQNLFLAISKARQLHNA